MSSVNPNRDPDAIFEVNTPRQTMSAKGTHFTVSVNPATGLIGLWVSAGSVSVSDVIDYAQDSIVLPAQQVYTYPGESAADKIEVVNLDELVQSLNPFVIEQLLKNKDEIDRENQQYIEQLREQLGNSGPHESLLIANEEDLQRIGLNLQYLVEHILHKASNRIDESTLEEMIRDANKALENRISIEQLPEWQLTNQERERQEQLQQLRNQKAEEQRKLQEETRGKQEQLLQEMQKRREQLEEQQRRAAEEAKKRAEEKMKEQLSQSARDAFEEAVRSKEAEKQRQNEAANREREMVEPTRGTSPNPETRPDIGTDPNPEPSPVPNPNPGPNPEPKPPSQIDLDLAAAKGNIPGDLGIYTEASRRALNEALARPERTNGEKIAKTKAILQAIRQLITPGQQEALDAINAYSSESSETPLDLLTAYAEEIGINISALVDGYEGEVAYEIAELVFSERPEAGFTSLADVRELLLAIAQEHIHRLNPLIVDIGYEINEYSVMLTWTTEEDFFDIRVFVNGDEISGEDAIEFSEAGAILKALSPENEYEIYVEFRREGSDYPNAIGERFIESWTDIPD